LVVPVIDSLLEAAAKIRVWDISVGRQDRFFGLSPLGGRFRETG
jgi:hypothetical protein